MSKATANSMMRGIMISCLSLALWASPSLANEESVKWNLDSIFGHSENSKGVEEHDSEWPTEEQPETPSTKCKTSDATRVYDYDIYDSEWPTEEIRH